MRWLILLGLVLPAPAFADLTATYRLAATGKTMKIEVAANGDVRGDVTVIFGRGMAKTGVSFIVHAGQSYFVQNGLSGLMVIRVADAAAIVAEDKAKKAKTSPIPLNFVEKGEARINGRTGTAYFARIGSQTPAARPGLVISKDSALGLLGPQCWLSSMRR